MSTIERRNFRKSSHQGVALSFHLAARLCAKSGVSSGSLPATETRKKTLFVFEGGGFDVLITSQELEPVLTRLPLPYRFFAMPATVASPKIASNRAAFATLAFLQSSIADGSIRADDAEGIEVASTSSAALHCTTGSSSNVSPNPQPVQCISEAFGVSLDSASDVQAYSIAPATLPAVLEAHVASAVRPPFRSSHRRADDGTCSPLLLLLPPPSHLPRQRTRPLRRSRRVLGTSSWPRRITRRRLRRTERRSSWMGTTPCTGATGELGLRLSWERACVRSRGKRGRSGGGGAEPGLQLSAALVHPDRR